MPVLYIKNMVCSRCIMVVRNELDNLGIGYRNVQLGEIELERDPSSGEQDLLRKRLESHGFGILDDEKTKVVEKLKTLVIQLIHDNEGANLNQKLSVYLSEKLQQDYKSLSLLFSTIEGVTLEKYMILQRVERVKELLMYGEMNLGEIADHLGYSSLHHLSQQFKQVTGLAPSHFRQLKENRRSPIDLL